MGIEQYIIGQKQNIPTFNSLIEGLKSGKNYNILIAGSSGYGKTYIGELIIMLSDCDKDCMIYDSGLKMFIQSKRIHLIDEAHTIKEPEFLYSYMDSGNYTFIILTNYYGDLKEPFRNRCMDIHLNKYSKQELGEIANLTISKRTGHSLNNFQKLVFGEKSRGTPRIAKNIAERVLLFTKDKIPQNEKELRRVLGILSIYKGGFREVDRRYLSFLAKVHTASLNTISQTLSLDKEYISNEIEPFLIEKELISITSKGRKINKGEDNEQKS